MPPVNIRFPLGGLNRRLDYQSQPLFTAPDLLNVLDRDCLTGRLRGGSRPGMSKAFPTQIGGITGAVSASAEFQPTKDTYLDSGATTTNRDTLGLKVGLTGGAIYRTILHFDLSSIPSSPTVTSASLRIYVTSMPFTYTNVYVRRIRRNDWVENEACWANYKGTGGGATPWTTAGAGSSVSDYDATYQTEHTVTGPGFYTFSSLAAIVQDALTNFSEQLHIEILSTDETVSRNFVFNDVEASNDRPTLTVNYTTGVGTSVAGSPIRMAAICQSLNTEGRSIYADTFDSAMSATYWTAGSFTVNGVATTGTLPSVSSGSARLSTGSGSAEARAAVLSGVTNISTTALREIVATTTEPDSSSEFIQLYLDLNNASLGEATAIRLIAEMDTAGNRSVSIYNGATLLALRNFAPGSGTFTRLILSIDGAGTIRYGWQDGVVGEYVLTGYTPPAAPRAGFSLRKVAGASSADCAMQSFTLNYSSSTGGDPKNMVMLVSNGILHKETIAGTLQQISSLCSLATDRLLMAAPFEQKLYIADYGEAASGQSGVTTYPGSVGTLTDAAADFVTAGVNINDYRLEILLEGSGPAGIYDLLSVSATVLTFTVGSDPSATGVYYRVVRCPKVYDATTGQLTKVQIGTIGSGDGQFPVNCSLVAVGMGRLWWSGDSRYPHVAFSSATGDPDNYLYALNTEGSAFAWDPAKTNGSAAIGDAVTALIPHRDDYFVFGCRNSAFVQRGDPTIGGRLDIITNIVGIIGAKAWSQLPDGSLVLGTTAGIYRVPPAPEAVPVPVSPLSLPQELKAIPTAFISSTPTVGTDVLLDYDVERSLVDIFLTPRAAGSSTIHFLHRPGDLEDVEGLLQYGGSFWRVAIPNTMDPTSIVSYTPSGGTRTVLIPGRDGYARKWNDAANDDDGTSFSFYVLYGPIMLSGSDYLDGMLEEVIVQTAKDSSTVAVAVQVGTSAESAFNATPQSLGTVAANTKRTFPIRRRGNAVIVRVSRSGAAAASIETLQIFRNALGKQRVG